MQVNKTCTKCSQELPISEYYVMNGKVMSACKSCHVRNRVKNIGKHTISYKLAQQELRKCFKCLIVKPFSEFYKDKSKKFGIMYLCKDCMKEYANKK